MVLKRRSFSVTFVPLLLVVLFAAANTEAACAKCDGMNATTSFEKHIGNTTCSISSFVPEVCNAYYNLSQCLNASGCKDFDTVTTKVAPTVCTVADFEKNCKRPPTANACAMCERINATASTSFKKHIGTKICWIHSFVPEACNLYYNLSQCLYASGCKDFENVTKKVEPTVCTVANFDKYCRRVTGVYRETVCTRCDRMRMTSVLARWLGTTTCLASNFLEETCTTFISLAQCLDSTGCDDFKNRAMTVAPTVCTVAKFEHYCRALLGWIDKSSTTQAMYSHQQLQRPARGPPAPTLRPVSGRQSGANDLSAYTTVGYPLVLFLCQAAVILLVLR